nr:MAG TPA_asm: hypothetical protein [Caudoviricetes sp.]
MRVTSVQRGCISGSCRLSLAAARGKVTRSDKER